MEASGVLYVRQKQWAVTYPGDTLDNGDKEGVDHQKKSVSVKNNKHFNIRRLNTFLRELHRIKFSDEWFFGKMFIIKAFFQ
jgi:hypothetical protein